MLEKLQPLWYMGEPTPLFVDDILAMSVQVDEDCDYDFDTVTFNSDYKK